MLKVAVFFGGDSVESDISVITGVGALSSLNIDKYKPYAIYVKDNRFWLVPEEKALCISTYTNDNKKNFKEVYISNKKLVYANKWSKKTIQIDVALLCTHGGLGENGGLQGLLEANDIPYTSTDIASSAICMDKDLTHKYLSKIGIKNVKYKIVTEKANQKGLEMIFKELGGKVIVKPNSLGSSVGVQSVLDDKQFFKAIQNALRYDNFVLVEQKVENLVEFNCACLQGEKGLIISDIDIPVRSKDILDFQDKYMMFEDYEKLKKNTYQINDKLKKLIISTTRKAYVELGLFGVVRIDYLFDSEKEELYLNEINTIPGSLSYYLFASRGLDLTDITDILINQAIARQDRKKALIKKFDNSLLTLAENTSPKLLQKFHK